MQKIDSELKSLHFIAKTLVESAEFFIDKYYEWEHDTPECYIHGTEEDIRRYQSFVANFDHDLNVLSEALIALSMQLVQIDTLLKRQTARRKLRNESYLKGERCHETVLKPTQKTGIERAAPKVRIDCR
jgi:ATP:corrinoid adenosyltransferase